MANDVSIRQIVFESFRLEFLTAGYPITLLDAEDGSTIMIYINSDGPRPAVAIRMGRPITVDFYGNKTVIEVSYHDREGAYFRSHTLAFHADLPKPGSIDTIVSTAHRWLTKEFTKEEQDTIQRQLDAWEFAARRNARPQ